MMEYVLTFEINAKEKFFDWIIRSYLHSRVNLSLYLGLKILAIYNFVSGLWYSPLLIVLNLLLFFYFDIYIVLRYFKIKKSIENYYGNEKTQIMYLKQDSIEFVSKNQHFTLQWKDISLVKETRWYFFIYNHNKISYGHTFKWFMTKDELSTLNKYYEEQIQLGRNITLRNKRK